MRTIGKRFSRNRPYGDYPAVDDYSGVVRYRSDMVRDGAGLLVDKRRAGKDRVTLAELEADHAASIHHEVPEHDGNGADIGQGAGAPVPLESVLAHAGQFVESAASTPLFLSAETTEGGEVVTLTYNSALKEYPRPAPSAYSLTGTSVGIADVLVMGNRVHLVLDFSIEQGQVVTVSSMPGSQPLQSVRGALVDQLSEQAVTNNSLVLRLAEWRSGLGYTFDNPTLTAGDDFSDAAWTKSNVSVSGGNLLTTTDVLDAFVSQAAANVDDTKSWTIVVEATAGTNSWIRVGDVNLTANAAWFNLATGELGTASLGVEDYDIESLGVGRYRCRVKFEASTANEAYVQLTDGDDSISVAAGRTVTLHSVEVQNGNVTEWEDQLNGYVLSSSAALPWVDPFGGPGLRGKSAISFRSALVTYMESTLTATFWAKLHAHAGAGVYVAGRGAALANGTLVATRRTGAGMRIQLTSSGGALQPQFFLEDADGTSLNNFPANDNMATGDSRVLSARYSHAAGPQVSFGVDGVEEATTNLDDWDDGGDPEGTLRIGTTPGTPFNSLTGQIAELVIFSGLPPNLTHNAVRARMEGEFSE